MPRSYPNEWTHTPDHDELIRRISYSLVIQIFAAIDEGMKRDL